MSTTLILLLISRLFAPQPLIVLDPGHGGSNMGAPTLNQHIHEKDLTLDTAQRVEHLLRARGFKVRMTRRDDAYLTLKQRAAMATGATCFVSIHYNTSKVHDRKGIEIFVPHSSAFGCFSETTPEDTTMLYSLKTSLEERSVMLAQTIKKRMPGSPRVAKAWFDVFEGLCTPSVLVELGFVDHPEEGSRILQASYRQHLAHLLADAIASSCR